MHKLPISKETVFFDFSYDSFDRYQPVYFKLFPHKGWGLLAANDIKPNTFIGEYKSSLFV